MLASIPWFRYFVDFWRSNPIFAPDNTETRFVGQNGFFTLASFSRLLSVLPIPIDRILQPLLEVHLGSEAKLLLRPFCI